MGKQIYNIHHINRLNLIAMMVEDKKDDNSSYSFVILDKHLNELTRYTLDREAELCTTFTEITQPDDNNYLFALGTGIADNITEPELGHIYLLQLNENLKIKKVGEIETKGGVYKIASKNNLLYVGISSTLYVYSVTHRNNNNENVMNSNIIENNKFKMIDQEYEIKLLRKNNEFTIINDIICHDDNIVVSDIYKSISIFKYDEEKEKLIECCRDYSPIWCCAMTQVENNIYLVTDIDGNIFSLRKEIHPKNDEEKYKYLINHYYLGWKEYLSLTSARGLINY